MHRSHRQYKKKEEKRVRLTGSELSGYDESANIVEELALDASLDGDLVADVLPSEDVGAGSEARVGLQVRSGSLVLEVPREFLRDCDLGLLRVVVRRRDGLEFLGVLASLEDHHASGGRLVGLVLGRVEVTGEEEHEVRDDDTKVPPRVGVGVAECVEDVGGSADDVATWLRSEDGADLVREGDVGVGGTAGDEGGAGYVQGTDCSRERE